MPRTHLFRPSEDPMMTKLEMYTAKAAESLAAAEAAATSRERAFHHRAYTIYRRLSAGLADAETRASTSTGR
jgi:hypothetical protein